MKNTILTLAGIIALGTTTLMADGSIVLVNDNVIAIAVANVELDDSTIGIDVQTNNSIVSASGNVMAIAVASSAITDESTVGVAVDDRD
jgi:hypothetical protein